MASTSDIDWVVISLKRTPDRLELFQLVNADVGLSYRILEAVDGLTVDREKVLAAGLMVEGLEWKPGALGAALSNLLCWERAIETGQPIGIIEDDVFLRHDFVQRSNEVLREMPEGWDIIHFGFNTDAIFDLEIHPGCNVQGSFSVYYPSLDDCERFVAVSDPVAPVRMRNSFGNCCYVVSPAGAKKLIDGVFPVEQKMVWVPMLNAVVRANSKDALMNELYVGMGAYVCMPPIALPINERGVSTIRPQ